MDVIVADVERRMIEEADAQLLERKRSVRYDARVHNAWTWMAVNRLMLFLFFNLSHAEIALRPRIVRTLHPIPPASMGLWLYTDVVV